ncbi:Hypothetical predicted protein [Cloeon dipterum]|uniref:Uncharacterized protein n=1 Tax=Cloeon dipterum TaxID=197152 RepID=A0A8S1DDA3_9INSE|nr:Hypothetical predicted protein [Cloeon dipterum]
MNILKMTSRIASMRSIMNPVRNNAVAGTNVSTNLLTRTLWFMCPSSSGNNQMLLTTKSHSLTCSCCFYYDLDVPTTAKGELLNYLYEEIYTRKHQLKEMDGFLSEAKGSVLELSKELGNDERIKIYFNVNHMVNPVEDPPREKDDEMRPEPTIKIELIKGDQILDLTCRFNYPYNFSLNYFFVIDEITLYKGERKNETYAIRVENVKCETFEMDYLLKDLLVDIGLNFVFARELYDLAYEHERKQRLDLLERLHKFVDSK